MKNKLPLLMLRVSLGLVFLLFGMGKFQNDVWAQTIKAMDFFLKLPWDVSISVLIIGAIEVITGIALILGLFTRFFAALAALQLAGILILLKFGETRDIGLLGLAIFLAFTQNDALGIDRLLAKLKRKIK